MARPADSLNRNVNTSPGSVTRRPEPPAQARFGERDPEAAVGKVVRGARRTGPGRIGEHPREGPFGVKIDPRGPTAEVRRARRCAHAEPPNSGSVRPSRTMRAPSAAKPMRQPPPHVLVHAQHPDHRGGLDRRPAPVWL